jgi:(1->4)-alpha-D-glucan 1-alpha-D-glucosylmutase
MSARVLGLRRRNPLCFSPGSSYRPLGATGVHGDHVIAYARGDHITVVAGRFPASRPDGWSDTTVAVAEGRWTDVLTGAVVDGGDIALAELLGDSRPAAVLERTTG